ncbi:hypothetical protein CBR_g55347 [Chara braunii]|uniref:Reverse transcriptase domain-containing protein n=1 Tax=Chara braunii TaxID=69332 RepID=A0A388MD55_CHABU|nr:hypothetical protein CBR_g55347 [Chara braunii]|eukprot:GBG92412.1 hypothetical protein CBR_g55347 [Chara braunii]
MEAFSIRRLIKDAFRRFAGEEAAQWLDGIVFGWTYDKSVAAHVCRPKQLFKDFDIEQWTKQYDPTQCRCRTNRYLSLHSQHTLELFPGSEQTHVLTMDTSIINNGWLQAMLKAGLNHVPLRAYDIGEALYEVDLLLDKLVIVSYDIASKSESRRRKLKQLVLQKAEAKMVGHCSKNRHISAEPIDRTSTRREIDFLTDHFLICPTDKSASTPPFVCVEFIRVLALRKLQGSDFVPLNEDPDPLIDSIRGELTHLPALHVGNGALPHLMTVYKAHKRTFRWITNTANTVVSPMASLCASLLSFLIPCVQGTCEEKSIEMEAEYGVKPNLWWPIASVGQFATNLPQLLFSVYTADITRCFETIPTDDSEHSLVMAVRFFVQLALEYRRDRSSRDVIRVRVSADGYFPSWVEERLQNTGNELFFNEEEIVAVTQWCLTHNLVQMGTCVWKQVLGIPMGLACSPVWCDIYFFRYEYQAMIRFLRTGNERLVPAFDDTYRYVDDLCSLNNPSTREFFKEDCDQITNPIWIYPKSYIEMKETTEVKDGEVGISTNFLNMTIAVSSREQGTYSTSKHDKKKGMSFPPCRFMRFNSNRSIAQSLQVITAQTALILLLCTDPREAAKEINEIVSVMFENGSETQRCWAIVKKLLEGSFDYHPGQVDRHLVECHLRTDFNMD